MARLKAASLAAEPKDHQQLAVRLLLWLAAHRDRAVRVDQAREPLDMTTRINVGVIITDRDLEKIMTPPFHEIVEAVLGLINHTDEDDMSDSISFRATTSIDYIDDNGNNIHVSYDKGMQAYSVQSECIVCGNPTIRTCRQATMKELATVCYLVGEEAGAHRERHRSFEDYLTEQAKGDSS